MIKQYLKDSAAYIWSGWGAASALLLFTALWEFGHQIYGSLILPSPIETMQALGRLYDEGIVVPAALTTAKRAMIGFFVAAGVGSILGIATGLSMTAARAMRPIITVMLGIPPITFAGAMMGTHTLDQGLRDMALTRISMDTAGTLALLVCVLGMLMAVEYLLLEPIRRKMEPWRRQSGQGNFNAPKGF